MSGVRVLVGTRKGAFILTSDGTRERWEVAGPHLQNRKLALIQFTEGSGILGLGQMTRR